MNPQDQQPQDQQQSQQPGQPQGQLASGDGQPQVVYMSRPLDPAKPEMSADVQRRHEESKKNHPRLNLSEGEYVISVVRRHPIGQASIWASTLAVVLAIFALAGVLYAAVRSGNSDISGSTTLSPAMIAIPALLIAAIALLFGYVSSSIYNGNKFILTNESIIQRIQTSLFNMREQTISLQSIEDASYSQDGIMPHMFNYGSIRLSTIGDEDTYRFHYASDPSKQIATLNNAVEAFKNGRRVGD